MKNIASTVYYFLIFIPAPLLFIMYIFCFTSSNLSYGEEKMNCNEKVLEIKKMEVLLIHVNNLGLSKYSKEKISKTIEFEIEMNKRDLFYKMGEESYEAFKKTMETN